MKKFILLLFCLLSTILAVHAVDLKWSRMPLTVYVPQVGRVSSWMGQAFKTWEQQSKGLISFKYVDSIDNANIVVEFVDVVENCNDLNAVGCTHMLHDGKMLHKSIITIGIIDYKYIIKNKKTMRKAVMRNKENIYGVMLHEVGHSLGLEHSKLPRSIMYPYDLHTMQILTQNDLNNLYKKYH